MSRLVHSESGYRRGLQISRTQLFIFVEGGLDRGFYDQYFRNTPLLGQYAYEIRAAKELPANTGGKPALLKHFRYLRKSKSLSGNAFGKKFACAFMLDKDIDDLSRKKVRSPHVIYTPTYDLEGHLVSCGDLIGALSIACGITFGQAQNLIGSKNLFLSKIVESWKEWLALCMLSQLNSINVGCSFDRNSAINVDEIGQVDQGKLAHFKVALAAKLNCSLEEIEVSFQNTIKKITNDIKKGQPLKNFKGKWFKSILQKYAFANLNVADATLNSVGEKVIVSLVAQVANRPSCPCCAPLNEAFAPILEAIS